MSKNILDAFDKDGFARKPFDGILGNSTLGNDGLRAASRKGHQKVVGILLEAGADANASGGNLGNALQAASHGTHQEVAEILLCAGADANAQGGYYGNALQAASWGGHFGIAKLLLEAGADVNALGGHYGTALRAASFSGHRNVVRLLLEAGAEVNLSGGNYGNALRAASRGNEPKIVQLLVEAGANIDDSGGNLGNALQVASANGHEKTVKPLLEAGADVNAPGGPYYGNAVQAASWGGHLGVVKLLLEAGADDSVSRDGFDNAIRAALWGHHNKVAGLLLDREPRFEIKPQIPLKLVSAFDTKREVGYDVELKVEKERSLPSHTSALQSFYGTDKLRSRRGGPPSIEQAQERGKSETGKVSSDRTATSVTPSGLVLDRPFQDLHVIDEYVHDQYSLDDGPIVNVTWELQRFIQEQLGGDYDLLDVMTVTGDPEEAYATTCSSYVQETWGDVGLDTVKFIISLAGSSEGSCSMMQICPLEETARAERCQIEVTTLTAKDAISVVQTIAWMAAVFRTPIPGPPRCSHLMIETFDDELWIRLGDLRTANPEASSGCWYGLLPSTNIAVGFPHVDRGLPGLELPFELMLDLTDIIHRTDLNALLGSDRVEGDDHHESSEEPDWDPPGRGIFYTGVASILYPVAKIHQGKTFILWHFDDKSTSALPPPDWLQCDSEDEFMEATHILGFTPDARVHLGTQDRQQQYQQIRHSSAIEEKGRTNLVLDSISVTVGQNPFQASFGGKIKYTRGQRVVTDSEKRKYDQILSVAEKQPVILYDDGSQKIGWLVPQLSVILDLIHYQAFKMQWSVPYFATLQANGGAAAAEVLRKVEAANCTLYHSSDDGSEYKIKHLVKDIYVAMSKRRITDEASPHSTSWFRRETLRGWDLLELLEPPDHSYRREIPVHDTTGKLISEYPSWLLLARRTPVYFGGNLGDIITSDSRHTVWRGSKLLVASMHTLHHLHRRIPNCCDFHLDCGLIWECRKTNPMAPPICVQDDHPEDDACRTSQDSVQVFLNNHKCKSCIEDLMLVHDDGAVAFGPKPSRLLNRKSHIDAHVLTP